MNTAPADDTRSGIGQLGARAALLSVIIATPDRFDTIRNTIAHLRKQTVGADLEIVIVAPARVSQQFDAKELEPFAGYRVVEVGSIDSIGRANAAGVRAASASIVALAEDHCFPEAGWAEALIAAHAGDWAAVGPGVRNANPSTAVSWADLFIGYGPWLVPGEAGEAAFLPGHNTSYKREVLLAYGEALASMLEAETLLHWDLRDRGYRLLFEPTAVVAHTNFSLWRSWIPIQFHSGRMFAGSRRKAMALWKRLVYVLGSPLIPAVRLARIAAQVRPRHLLKELAFCAHALAIGLALDAMGQLVGYATGIGNARDRVARYEFRRVDHVTSDDRQSVFGDGVRQPDTQDNC